MSIKMSRAQLEATLAMMQATKDNENLTMTIEQSKRGSGQEYVVVSLNADIDIELDPTGTITKIDTSFSSRASADSAMANYDALRAIVGKVSRAVETRHEGRFTTWRPSN